MTDRDYTAKTDRWNLGSDDSERLENLVTNLVADNVEFALKEFIPNIVAHFSDRSEDGVGIYFGHPDYEEEFDKWLPLTEIIVDYDEYPELFAAIVEAIKAYENR